MGFFYDDENDVDYPEGFDVTKEEDWDELIRKQEELESTVDEDFPDDREFFAIPSYPYYLASRDGRIRSDVGPVPRILKTFSNKHGHEYVGVINEQNEHKKELVHRLVATTFVENPEGYPLVRHLNDNPKDNRVENLAWGTQKDNVADMIRNGHATTKAVYCYEEDKTYPSGREAAKKHGISPAAITHACKSGTVASGKHFCLESQKEDRLRDVDEWLKETDLRKPLVAINPKTGEKLYFSSRKEAAKKLGIPDCGISSVISGHINTTHGWSFEDMEESDG